MTCAVMVGFGSHFYLGQIEKAEGCNFLLSVIANQLFLLLLVALRIVDKNVYYLLSPPGITCRESKSFVPCMPSERLGKIL